MTLNGTRHVFASGVGLVGKGGGASWRYDAAVGGWGGGEGYTTRRDKESVASKLREKLF